MARSSVNYQGVWQAKHNDPVSFILSTLESAGPHNRGRSEIQWGNHTTIGYRTWTTEAGTLVPEAYVRFHDTDIVVYDLRNEAVTLDTGGWLTRSTKDRMNYWLPKSWNIRLDGYTTKDNWSGPGDAPKSAAKNPWRLLRSMPGRRWSEEPEEVFVEWDDPQYTAMLIRRDDLR